jgi:hypothetical protein
LFLPGQEAYPDVSAIPICEAAMRTTLKLSVLMLSLTLTFGPDPATAPVPLDALMLAGCPAAKPDCRGLEDRKPKPKPDSKGKGSQSRNE